MLLTFGRKTFHFVTAKYRYSPTVLQFYHTTMRRSGNGESLYTLTRAFITFMGFPQFFKKITLWKQLNSHVQMTSASTAKQTMALLCVDWAIMRCFNEWKTAEISLFYTASSV